MMVPSLLYQQRASLFFFPPSQVVAATNLLTVIFLIMCGNVPILVGSGIGILLPCVIR